MGIALNQRSIMSIVIIDYGAGNIQSIRFALERLGKSAVLSHHKEEILNASHVLFPGVGEASSAMKKLKQTGLDTLIPSLTQPVLGICLGMQLMCNHSEEGDTPGLGIFDTEVIRFKTNLNVPHMGWNTVESSGKLFASIPQNSPFYMVHSYYAHLCDSTSAVCVYDHPFSAALEKSNFYGTQFHPEKAGQSELPFYKIF